MWELVMPHGQAIPRRTGPKMLSISWNRESEPRTPRTQGISLRSDERKFLRKYFENKKTHEKEIEDKGTMPNLPCIKVNIIYKAEATLLPSPNP
jgi:hypothetical protein